MLAQKKHAMWLGASRWIMLNQENTYGLHFPSPQDSYNGITDLTGFLLGDNFCIFLGLYILIYFLI